MKSSFPVKVFIVAILMLAGIFFLISCLQSEGANWKEFFQDDYGIYYYDKDSIHYPQQKKTLFCLTAKNK
jgi:hypothetical protein